MTTLVTVMATAMTTREAKDELNGKGDFFDGAN